MSPLSRPPGPAQLADFPTWHLRSGYPLFRIHLKIYGPWWFSHGRSNRFNLGPPRGTCYFADEPAGAFIEALQDVIPHVPTAEVSARCVSAVRVGDDLTLADCTSALASAFGITGEIHSSRTHGRSRAWAKAFCRAGFDGIRYRLRHDPSQHSIGIALFGAAGASTAPVISTDAIDDSLVVEVGRRFGIQVIPPHS